LRRHLNFARAILTFVGSGRLPASTLTLQRDFRLLAACPVFTLSSGKPVGAERRQRWTVEAFQTDAADVARRLARQLGRRLTHTVLRLTSSFASAGNAAGAEGLCLAGRDCRKRKSGRAFEKGGRFSGSSLWNVPLRRANLQSSSPTFGRVGRGAIASCAPGAIGAIAPSGTSTECFLCFEPSAMTGRSRCTKLAAPNWQGSVASSPAMAGPERIRRLTALCRTGHTPKRAEPNSRQSRAR
jgi:hypothetical protein